MSSQYKVHKYPLVLGECSFSLPKGTRVMSVGATDVGPNAQVPCLWALIPMNEPVLVERRFKVVWTGESFSMDGITHFVGTVTCKVGTPPPLVYHVFEYASPVSSQ